MLKRILVLLFISGMAFGEGNAPINYGTATHVVKKPPSVPDVVCDFDFTGLTVCGLGGGGGGTGTVTNFSAGNLSPLFTTSVTDPTGAPTLLFQQLSSAAHTYYGNNTAGTATPGFHVINFVELGDVPNSYAGQATKIVRVKADESGLEFVAAAAATPTATATSTPTPTATSTPSATATATATPTATPTATATATPTATAVVFPHAVTFVADGSGSVLSTGTKNPIKIPYGGTLVGWLLIGSPSGSVTVDVFRAADGAGLPVTSIIGGSGTKPALSSAVENSSTSFTSWTSTTLTAKDNLTISLSGVTTTTYVALTLYYQ